MEMEIFGSSMARSKPVDLLREARITSDGVGSMTVAELGNLRLSVANVGDMPLCLGSIPTSRVLFVVDGTVQIDPPFDGARLSRGELLLLPKDTPCIATADSRAILMTIETAAPGDALDGQPGAEFLNPIWV